MRDRNGGGGMDQRILALLEELKAAIAISNVS
jgi:hypothetical protein